MNFRYLYNNPGNVYGSTCNAFFTQSNSFAVCPSAAALDWRIYSSDENYTYYNPSVQYDPWVGNCSSSTACGNASFTSARSYPVSGVADYSTTRNLSTSQYSVWIDDRGFNGSRPLRGVLVNANSTPNGLVDLWDSHMDIVLNSSSVQVYSVTYSPNAFGLQTNRTLRATLSSSTACYNILGTADSVNDIFSGTKSYSSTGDDGCRTIAQAQQNFANWYQYYRRRSMAARGSIGYILDQFPNFRYGINTINNSFFTEVPPASTSDFTSHNNAITQQVYQYDWNALGTPLRSALDRAGRYYAGTLFGRNNPITASCQQNYTILFTDGYWNAETIPSAIGDVDGDGISKTLADVARYYYINDLSPLANNVTTNQWDPANWQHMVTFTVGFGINGNLVAGTDGWPSPALDINSNWGDPFNDDGAKADDLWHAAFNSKGTFLRAQSPDQLRDSLSQILSTIFARGASASSAAQNSSIINANSKIYQSTFDSDTWSGTLYAYGLDTNNNLISTPLWSTNCLLSGGNCQLPAGTNPGISPTNRTIVTRNWTGSNTGMAFRFPTNYTSYKSNGVLPTNLANILTYSPYPATTTKNWQISAVQAYGTALVNYLRGDRSNEMSNNGTYKFRNRQGVIGDIINSNAVFVGSPQRIYPDTIEASPYSSFKQSYINRIPMIYVGANDGMLHGFNANTGTEELAYIPGAREIFKNLPLLSQTTYPHAFFVDGSPTVGDVYINGAWKTILVGGLRNGGQTIYALDITNPDNFTETNASNIYLWEFSDKDDPDLGYVYGNAVIGKVRSGTGQTQWAVIIGNGYNSLQSDGYVSSTGKPTLFILFIQPGIGGTWTVNQKYIKIPLGNTPANASGLGTPYPVDVDGDYIIDYIYAGDLQGNIWRVDLRNATPTNWAATATNIFTASNSQAGDQPVTAPLIVAPHPNGIQSGVMVYFGTGKYLEPGDVSTAQATQSFYGIWDKFDNIKINKNQLVQQQILAEITPANSTNTYRAVSNNSVNWDNPNARRGWYLNLLVNGSSSNYGERVISQPVLRNGNIIFTTILPSGTLCDFGGDSWLMELNALNGGAPNSSPFDLNNDGKFSTADYLNIGSSSSANYVAPAGMRSPVGIIPTPAILLSGDKTKEVKVLSGLQGITTVNESTGTVTGRQNWRQLY